MEGREVFGVDRERSKPVISSSPYTPINNLKDLLRTIKTLQRTGYYRRRSEVEEDPAFRQIIMYGFVMNEKGEVLTYQKKNSRTGSVKVLSFGIGGHTEQQDRNIIEGFYREIGEELEISNKGIPLVGKKIKKSVSLRTTGIINDEKDNIGLSHIAVAVRIEPRKSQDVNFTVSKTNGENSLFRDPESLLREIEAGEVALEGWDEILLKEEILPKIRV